MATEPVSTDPLGDIPHSLVMTFNSVRRMGQRVSYFHLPRRLEAVTAVATDMKSSSPKFVGDGSPLHLWKRKRW